MSSGRTIVEARIGMKLASPFQRGTRCWWRWSATPAPATEPTFMPTLNPSALRTRRSARNAGRRSAPDALQRRFIGRFRARDVLVRNDHDVAGVIREEVHHDEGALASMEDQRLDIVVGREAVAKETALFLGAAADVAHAPGSPESLDRRLMLGAGIWRAGAIHFAMVPSAGAGVIRSRCYDLPHTVAIRLQPTVPAPR